ncbi:MAG: hypothetical protein IJ197_10615 [Bacteroidaceae bacterium]|nr:hypothetical protein [Bacteroidaceae bacterium]
MRHAIRLILLLLPLYAFAQNPTTLDGWAERLKLFGEKVPQEEVFVHMDNSCYYLGDTIYFKAYVRLSSGRPSSLSQLLYAELWNHDGYLVERQKIELKQGQGYGSFCLADTLYGGYYELRAYTRWQLNWGQTEHKHSSYAEKWFFSPELARDYYRDYEKLYSRVFPVYDHPREAGDYAQEMTMRPLQRQVGQTEEKPRAMVTFYPEGGDLVGGVTNRVAFEARDQEGRHLTGHLKVGNQTVETVSRGRGVFETDGTAMKAVFEWEGGSASVNLPKAVADGVAMQASVEDDGIHVRLHRAGTAAAEPLGLTASCHGVQQDFQTIDGDELVVPQERLSTGVIQLTVFNAAGRIYADRLVFFRHPGFQAQNISFSGLKSKYEPYERVNLDVQCEMSGVGQGAISLAVRDAAHSDYTFDSGNIMTEMLLASQIRGFVEQPQYFFEEDDQTRRQALDLLLMVQGWRRYKWTEMATPGAFMLSEPYERTEVLTGQVMPYQAEEQEDLISRSSYISYLLEEPDLAVIDRVMDSGLRTLAEKNVVGLISDSHEATTALMSFWGQRHEMNNTALYGRLTAEDGGKLKNEVLLHAEFLQPGAENGIVEGDMQTFSGGRFKIEAPHFYEACHFFLSASDTTRWKPGKQHNWVEVNEDEKGRLNYPEFYVRLRQIHPRFPKPYSFYQTAVPQARPTKRLQFSDVVVMDELTVRTNRTLMRKFDPTKPAFVLDAIDAYNQTIDAGLCPGYYTGARRFVDDVARTFVGDMGLERAYAVETRINSKITGANVELLSEADLMSTSSADPRKDQVRAMAKNAPFISMDVKDKYDHLPNLDMVYVYTDYAPRREGDARYESSNQPTVTIDLRRFEDEGQRMTWRDRRLVLTGFAVCEDFYQPDYSKQKPSEPTDYRRTLYWNPDVQLDAEGRATLQFYNNSRPTRLTVSAEGMTPTGQPLTGISYPEDR